MFQGEGDVFGVGREHVGSGIAAVSKWAHESYCGRGRQRFLTKTLERRKKDGK